MASVSRSVVTLIALWWQGHSWEWPEVDLSAWQREPDDGAPEEEAHDEQAAWWGSWAAPGAEAERPTAGGSESWAQWADARMDAAWAHRPWRGKGGQKPATPAPPAQASSTSSWASFLLDFLGWALFGPYWGGVRTYTMRVLGVVLVLLVSAGIHHVACALGPLFGTVSIVLHGLVWVLRWVATWGGRRAIRTKSGETTQLEFWGPSVARYPTTAALRTMKGGGGGEPQRAVLCIDTDVILVETDVAGCSAINRHGMTLGVGAVVGTTSRRTGRALMSARRVHLCRASPCTDTACGDDTIHVTCFCGVAAGDPVDVYTVIDRGAYRWCLGRLAAWLYHALVGLPWLVARRFCRCCCWCWCCGGRRLAPAVAARRGGRRSEESESETEDDREPCAAHRVCWEGPAGKERLTNRGECKDVDAAVATLLAEDAAASGVGPEVSLCGRHRASYLSERWALRCPHEGCARRGSVALGGLRVCPRHADESDAAERVQRQRLAGNELGADTSRKGLVPDGASARSPQSGAAAREAWDALETLDLGGSSRGSVGLRRRAKAQPGKAPSPAGILGGSTRATPEAVQEPARAEGGSREPSRSRSRSSGRSRLNVVEAPARPPEQANLRVDRLLQGLMGRSDEYGPPDHDAEGALERYLSVRESCPEEDDGGARAVVAADLDLDDEQLTERLVAEAEQAQADGQQGLGLLLQRWRQLLSAQLPQPGPRPGEARSRSSSSWQVLADTGPPPMGASARGLLSQAGSTTRGRSPALAPELGRPAPYGSTPTRPFGVGRSAVSVGPSPVAPTSARTVPVQFTQGNSVYDALLRPSEPGRRTGASEPAAGPGDPALREVAQAIQAPGCIWTRRRWRRGLHGRSAGTRRIWCSWPGLATSTA